MRETKFRGKRLDNGEWEYGDLVQFGQKYYTPCKCAIIPGTASVSDTLFKVLLDNEVDPATVGEYTGLKDKNGKEIYVGDIIECIGSDNKPIRHLVRYNDEKGGYGQLLFMDNGLTCKPYDGGLISQNYICEMDKYIVSNLHDNPELLKGGEKCLGYANL